MKVECINTWWLILVMQILLHAGFHKSGTTSIQQALLELKNRNFIYPHPKKFTGPGHSHIAWAGQDKSSPNYDPDILLKLVSNLSKKFTLRKKNIFVLSSEDFTATSNFEAIRRLAQEHEVHLVLTRRPVYEALPSLQQELIKHGSTHAFLSQEGVTEAGKHMQFDINRISHFLNSSDFKKISVISTSSSKPSFIFENFNRLLGINLVMKIQNVGLTGPVLHELVSLNINNPNQDNLSRIQSAIKLAENSYESSTEISFSQSWAEMEKKLIEFFTSLESNGIIEFISAE